MSVVKYCLLTIGTGKLSVIRSSGVSTIQGLLIGTEMNRRTVGSFRIICSIVGNIGIVWCQSSRAVKHLLPCNITNTCTFPGVCAMWQSHVKIKGYSVAYFNHIAVFEAPLCCISVKGGAHMHPVDLLDIHASMKHIWALPLMEVQRYSASTQQSDRNMWQNNLWFLHRTVTYTSYMILVPIDPISDLYTLYTCTQYTPVEVGESVCSALLATAGTLYLP